MNVLARVGCSLSVSSRADGEKAIKDDGHYRTVVAISPGNAV